MPLKGLDPGVQNHQAADLGPQVLRRGGDFQERLAGGANGTVQNVINVPAPR